MSLGLGSGRRRLSGSLWQTTDARWPLHCCPRLPMCLWAGAGSCQLPRLLLAVTLWRQLVEHAAPGRSLGAPRLEPNMKLTVCILYEG